MDKDVKLAKDIIKKMRELLSPKFDYILQFTPEIKFYENYENDDELLLDSITFTAGGEYKDTITVFGHGVFLELEDGQFNMLLDVDELSQVLKCESNDMLELPTEIEELVDRANELYRKNYT